MRPPEQVQSSFDDVLKAGQERERAKNEAQAYANDVIPRAVALRHANEEAAALQGDRCPQAQGDAQRFRVDSGGVPESAQVTRDRMYHQETMQQIYGNVTKVLVESRPGFQPLLYLPLDKIMQGLRAVRWMRLPGTSPVDSGGVVPGDTCTHLFAMILGRAIPARTRERESR